MLVLALVLPILLTHSLRSESVAVSQSRASADCREWRECQQLALEAAERREYETFHDLAWRTVQTGPPKDPALMYLLARAQSLSGRPHDALIMLQRLAEAGVASDAATNDDFRRTRALAGWPDLQTLIERVRNAGTAATTAPTLSPAPAPATTAAPPPETVTETAPALTVPTSAAAPTPAALPEAVPAPTAPAVTARGRRAPPPAVSRAGSVPAATIAPPGGLAVFKPEPVEQAVRITTPRFSASGLAYDTASGRFVVGDLHGRKLIVVGEGADHAVDLVQAESAGFHDIMAIEIDHRRGALWVATATPEDTGWAIHELQLISGRPLKVLPAAADLEPMKLVDLAVSPAGVVLALDAKEARLFELPPRGTGLKPVLRLAVQKPTSLAATSDEGVVYVAHGAGVSRVDLKTRTALPVAVPPGLDFGQIERLRWHRQALLAVIADSDGARRLVRFDLNGSGRAVTAATIIDRTIPGAAGPIFATVSGDELSYVVADADRSSQPQEPPPGPLAEFIIRRIRLH